MILTFAGNIAQTILPSLSTFRIPPGFHTAFPPRVFSGNPPGVHSSNPEQLASGSPPRVALGILRVTSVNPPEVPSGSLGIINLLRNAEIDIFQFVRFSLFPYSELVKDLTRIVKIMKSVVKLSSVLNNW